MDISDYFGAIFAFAVIVIAIFQMIRKAFIKEEEKPEEEVKPIPTPTPRTTRRLRELERQLHEAVQPPKVDYYKRDPVPSKERYDAYKIVWSSKESRGRLLLEKLPTKREMVILSEIIGPPKAFL